MFIRRSGGLCAGPDTEIFVKCIMGGVTNLQNMWYCVAYILMNSVFDTEIHWNLCNAVVDIGIEKGG